MVVKRYFAQDMQEAMSKIREELGTDAVILNNKTVRKKGVTGLFSKPYTEVVVAYEPQKPSPPKRMTWQDKEEKFVPVDTEMLQKAATVSRAQNEALDAQDVGNISEVAQPPLNIPPREGISPSKQQSIAVAMQAQEDRERLNDLDRKIDELSNMITSFSSKFRGYQRDLKLNLSEEVEALAIRLLDNEVQEELAFAIAKETQKVMDKLGADPTEVMKQLIKEYIGEPQPIRLKQYKRNVVMVVGPTGVGKTTSLIKLAAHFAMREKLKVGLINADTYRIAAQEQLKTYAEILNAPIHMVYNQKDMEQALKAQEDCDLVFVDTMGKRTKDKQGKEELQALVELCDADEIFLVLSAPTGDRALREIIKDYIFLKDFKLIITKMDEPHSAGILVNACHYSGKGAAYVTTGQDVPDDISVTNLDEVVDRVLEQQDYV